MSDDTKKLDEILSDVKMLFIRLARAREKVDRQAKIITKLEASKKGLRERNEYLSEELQRGSEELEELQNGE